MTTDPLDAIMRIMEQAFDPCYGEAWNRRQVADALLLTGTHVLLAPHPAQSGAMAAVLPPPGFALSRQAADEEELLLIGVMPGERGKGIGRALLQQLFDQARQRGSRRLFLEMRDGNPAMRLYRQLGFEEVGRRRGYYRRAEHGPIDAITFARPL